jgi:hypothetical protein
MDREREAWTFAEALLRNAVGAVNPYNTRGEVTDIEDVIDMVRSRFPDVVGPAFQIEVTFH